ncbi:MAG: hypothetical protein R2794_11710 [Chitinophagales bacterium]
MKQGTHIIFATFFAAYLLTVLLTDISLTGFWTDIIFAICLSIFALRLVFKIKTDKIWLTITFRAINFVCSLIVFGLLGLNLINPFAWDTFKLRSFYYQSMDGRLFNAYFKPVGAYAGGYGNFWITETPKYFPLIEWRVYWDRTVDWDFNIDTFDGQPVDNYAVVRSYIKVEVIDKQD